jgi:hypothetical protein
MPLTFANSQLGRLAGAFFPGAPWLGTVTSVTTVASVFADLWVNRHLSRPLPDAAPTERIREMYREEAERLRAQRATTPAAQPAAAPPPPSTAPSLYLATEGVREDPNGIEEGCVPCALGHDGAGHGMLERAAAEAEREGRCGPACQAWYVPAAREYLALLRHDWTPERIAQTPEEQRRVIEARLADHVELKDLLVAGADPDPERKAVREAILGADASIVEATRFTASGDPVTHPMVQKRLLAAEPDLLAGERGRTTVPPPEVKARVRQNRQELLNSLRTPEDLARVASRAEEIDLEVMRPAVERLTPADVRAAAERARDVRLGLKRDLAAAAAPTQAQIAAAAGVAGGG